MLSRVAESLYWAARSIERAENTCRLLLVYFHGLLDADLPDHGQAWRELLLLIGRDDLFREHFADYSARSVSEFLLFHPANPDAVTASVSRARENLRGVREQISSEMWENVNRLHLFVAGVRPAMLLAAPHEFFLRIREGSHAFQGVTKATMPRGEGYEFIQLGSHLERGDATARLLAVKVPALAQALSDHEETGRLTTLLKSCGGFEAFRKQESDQLRAPRVVEYLLLEPRFPRSVLFCVELSLNAIRAISGSSSERPERAVGRLYAELSFADATDLVRVQPLLGRVAVSIDEAAGEVAAAYFTTRVILPGPYAQQQQQQQ